MASPSPSSSSVHSFRRTRSSRLAAGTNPAPTGTAGARPLTIENDARCKEQGMSTTMRWTIADLDQFPDPVDDTRYEIIDGELYVSKQPAVEHQYTCNAIAG